MKKAAKQSTKPGTPVKKVKPSQKAEFPTAQEVSVSDATAPLMPELEELVKKNPNRLIGCGG